MDFGAVYPLLRQGHIALVALSVSLFMARGLGVLAGAVWPQRAWVRRGTAAIDTLLLAAGIALWIGLGLNPMVQTWLGVKLLLLPIYIVFGSLALGRARSPALRWLCFALALATVALIATIATTRDPLLAWL